MTNEIPDLVYIYPSFYPEDNVAKEIEAIKHPDLNIVTHKNEEGSMFNAFEWIIPTAFGVYILKPYFEGFLSEAGKDHYVLLKKFIDSFLEKGKEFNFSIMAASKSTEKLSKKYNNSFSVSVELQTKNNRIVKLLFSNSLTVEEWKEANSKILDAFEDHYKNYPNDNLTSLIKKFDDKPHRKLYIIVDKNPKDISIKDDNDMISEFRND
jgi:hypothetical protein